MTETTPPTEANEPIEVPAQETDWKALARKWEDRAKANWAEAEANKGAASKLAELEEAQKSEQQKLTDRLAELEKRAATAERDRERLQVIAKHSIPEEFHGLVHGDSEEALEASAAQVGELIKRSATSRTSPYVIPTEGNALALPLNGDGIESALKNALGIN